MRKDLEEKTISVEKIFKGKVLDVEVAYKSQGSSSSTCVDKR